MERMKFKIILGAGQEGLITSDFDGEPTRDLTGMSWSDQTREIVRTRIIQQMLSVDLPSAAFGARGGLCDVGEAD